MLVLAGCAGRDGERAAVPTEEGGTGMPGVASGAGGGLRGISVRQLTERLGPASFHRTDGPTELLQYRSDACVLDVFVYHDSDGDAGRVEYVEARTPTRATMAEDACIQTIAARKPAQRRD